MKAAIGPRTAQSEVLGSRSRKEAQTIRLLRTAFLFLTLLSPLRAEVSLAPAPKPVRASFYADGFEGRLMANGQRFHQKSYLAASLDFPIGTVLRVSAPRTGRSVLVIIADRGPWTKRFQLDLSKAAFQELGFKLSEGWGWVTLENATGVLSQSPAS